MVRYWMLADASQANFSAAAEGLLNDGWEFVGQGGIAEDGRFYQGFQKNEKLVDALQEDLHCAAKLFEKLRENKFEDGDWVEVERLIDEYKDRSA
jgi:hypothetical protein